MTGGWIVEETPSGPAGDKNKTKPSPLLYLQSTLSRSASEWLCGLMNRAPPAAGAAGDGQCSVQPLAEEAASPQQPQAAWWQILPRVQVPRGERLGQKAGHPEGRAQEVFPEETRHVAEGTSTYVHYVTDLWIRHNCPPLTLNTRIAVLEIGPGLSLVLD